MDEQPIDIVLRLIDELSPAVDRAKRGMREAMAQMKGEVPPVNREMERLAQSLSGNRILQDAQNIVGAVDKIGGVTKLTTAEKARLNATLNEAIDKYRVMGKDAPKAMVDLESATRKVEQPTNALNAQMVALGSAIGSFLGNLAYDSVRRLATSMGTLVMEGLRSGAVVNSFERLTESIGETSGAMLAATRTATKGLITDLDIMQASNKAILLGLPVTSQEFGSLSAAAVTLGKAMGQSATKSLDDLITALGRSSPLILDNLGLTVKVGEANAQYAAALGKTVSQLTDADKKTAFYRAAVDAAREKMETLGGVQLTLADQGTRLATAFENQAHAAGRLVETALRPLVVVLSAVPQPVVATTVTLATLTGGLAAARLGTMAMSAAFAATGPLAGTLAMGTAALTGAVGTLTAALSFLALTPMGLAITAAAALAAGFVYLKGRTDDASDSSLAMHESLLRVEQQLLVTSDETARLNELLAAGKAHVHAYGDELYYVGRSAEEAAELERLLAREIEANKRQFDANRSSVERLFGATTPLTRSLEDLKKIETELTATAKASIVENERLAKSREQAARKLEADLQRLYSTLANDEAMIRFTDDLAMMAEQDAALSMATVQLDDRLTNLNATWLDARVTIEALTTAVPTLNAHVADTERVVTDASRAADEAKGSFGSFFDGISEGFDALWQGMSGGKGLSGLFSNLGKGLMDGFGDLLSGGLASLINTGVGAVVSGVKKLFGIGKSEDRIIGEKATADIKRLQEELLDTYGSLENIIDAGGAAGEALAAAWGSQNVEGLKWFKQLMAEFTDAVEENEQAIKEARGTFGDLTDTVDVYQARLANTDAVNAFRAQLAAASHGGQLDLRQLFNELGRLKTSLGHTPEIEALEDALVHAADTGIVEFDRFAFVLDALKEQFGVAYDSMAQDTRQLADEQRRLTEAFQANWMAGRTTAANNNDLLSPAAFPSYEAWLANWLERNPGDLARAQDALGGHQFATGTPGLGFMEFGSRGSMAWLHNQEAVVPKGREAEFARRHGVGGDPELRAEVAAMRREFRDLPFILTQALKSARALP